MSQEDVDGQKKWAQRTFQTKVTECEMFRSRLPLPASVTGEASGVTRPCHDTPGGIGGILSKGRKHGWALNGTTKNLNYNIIGRMSLPWRDVT